nr:glutathione synthase [Halisarca dujardinii]
MADAEFCDCLAASLGLLTRDVQATGLFKPFKLTLSPSPLPASLLEEICCLQPHFNALVDAISRDDGFLQDTLKRTFEADDFSRRLWDMYQKCLHLKNKPAVLSVLRNDYMMHCEGEKGQQSLGLKQVEINTIASAYLATAPDVVKFHRVTTAGSKGVQPHPCDSLNAMAEAFASAHRCYGKDSAVVLTVILNHESNLLDQRKLDAVLWERYQIRGIRLTLTQLYKMAKHGPAQELFVNGEEVSIVYYRSGYTDKHYYSPDDAEWAARLVMESSKAICIPSVGHHLAGTKKVQQVLASPGVLERFVDETIAKRMRAVFTGLYSLDLTPEGDKAAALALQDPRSFVLKPQKEGGGNNYFGEKMEAILRDLSGKKDREQYILMDLIRTPTHRVEVLIDGAVVKVEVVPEYSVFGIYLRSGEKVLVSSAVPHLVRSKTVGTTEGGVSNGTGFLDSLRTTSFEEYKAAVSLPQH